MKTPSLILMSLALTWALGGAAHSEDSPEPWLTFTDEWQAVGIPTSYYSIELHNNQVGLWFNAHFQGHDSVIHLQGDTLSQLERVLPRFDATIIRGYDQDLGDRTTPIISRSNALRLKDGSVLVQASIGPGYDGGRSELYPVLFHSPDGINDWRYLGSPAGEPRSWLEQQRQNGQRIRCEGGGIVQLADGRLRLYEQNLGASLAIIEAESIDGPWTFVRNEDGEIHNAVAGLEGSWLFPHVIAVGERGYILTAGNTWPPTAIRAVVSRDGLSFSFPWGDPQRQFVLMAGDVLSGATSLKTLRMVWDPEQERLLCVSNPWQQGGFALYWNWADFDYSAIAR